MAQPQKAQAPAVKPAPPVPSPTQPVGVRQFQSEPFEGSKARYTYNEQTDTMTITYPNGQAVALDLSKVSHAIDARIRLNGLKQKLADTTGGKSTGDKLKAVIGTFAELVRGEWVERRPGESKEVKAARIAQAIISVYGAKFQAKHKRTMTESDVAAYDKKLYRRMVNDPKVKAALGKASKEVSDADL